MIHRPGEISVRKRDPAKRRIAQDLSRRRPPLPTEEEPRLGAQIGMTPAVKDYSSYIPSRIESRSCKHFGKLFADSSLIIPESSREQFLAAEVTLFLCGVTRIRKQNF
jgi:hypothetical protein